jgi:acylphosphatase
MKRVHVFVSGMVQGVSFRYYTGEKARELGVKGWVKNLADGRVEIVAEGEEERLRELIEFCRKGEFGAEIEKVEVKWGEFKGEFEGFERRY